MTFSKKPVPKSRFFLYFSLFDRRNRILLPVLTFEQIYRDNKHIVFNLCLQYVQNVQDAEEITQDVFVKISQSLEKFQQQSKASTWVYRITINACQDFIRYKTRKKRFARLISLGYSSAQESTEPPHFDHPGVKLEQKELVSRLFAQINSLPPKQKTAFILSKFEHKSLREIAEIMNTSAKAAESLVQRAKAQLSKYLQASEGKP